MTTPTPTGFSFLYGGVQTDFADVFNISYPQPGIITNYFSANYGLDLGQIFTPTTGGTIPTSYYISTDLGSIFTPIPTNTWSALTSGITSTSTAAVYAVTIDNLGRVYVGGSFTTAGGVPATNVAMWTPGTSGSPGTWSALGSGTQNFVQSLAVDNLNRVYVGGIFTSAGGVANTKAIALWTPAIQGNPGYWSSVGEGITQGLSLPFVNVITIRSTGDVYVGGVFIGLTNNGVSVSDTINIAKWTPSTGLWYTVGGGIYATTASIGGVYSIAFDSTETYVYVGGAFSQVNYNAPLTVNRIAKMRLSDSVWFQLGTDANVNGVNLTSTSGSNSYVYSIAIDSSDTVYVGGNFISAGCGDGNPTYTVPNTRGIASWFPNSNVWGSVGVGLSSSEPNVGVSTIKIDNLDINNINIYAGGFFTTINATIVNNIAKYNATSQWTTLDGGVTNSTSNASIFSLAINGLTVYAGGSFTTAGTATQISANNIAAWN